MVDPSNPASVYLYGLAFLVGLFLTVRVADRRLWTGTTRPPRIVRGLAIAAIGVVGATVAMLAVMGVNSFLADVRS